MLDKVTYVFSSGSGVCYVLYRDVGLLSDYVLSSNEFSLV